MYVYTYIWWIVHCHSFCAEDNSDAIGIQNWIVFLCIECQFMSILINYRTNKNGINMIQLVCMTSNIWGDIPHEDNSDITWIQWDMKPIRYRPLANE